MSLRKDNEKFLKFIEAHGFVLIRSTHHNVYKRGKLTFVASRTPSDPRSLLNQKQQFARLLKQEEK